MVELPADHPASESTLIRRAVMLVFEPDFVPEALAVLNEVVPKIRRFHGCTFVEVLSDIHKPAVFFTLSYWESEEHLNAYRHSPLFLGLWPRLKKGFAEPARAWSTRVVPIE